MTVYVFIYLLVQMPNQDSTNYVVKAPVFKTETGCLRAKNYWDAKSRMYQKFYFSYCQKQEVEK